MGGNIWTALYNLTYFFKPTQQKNFKKIWISFLFILAKGSSLFFITFLISTPYFLINFTRYVAAQKGNLQYLDGLFKVGNVSWNPFNWFQTYIDQTGPGTIFLLVIGFIGIVVYFNKKFRKGPLHKNKDCSIFIILTTMSLYVVCSFVFLFIAVRKGSLRYSFHIFPFILIIGIWGTNYLFLFIKSRIIDSKTDFSFHFNKASKAIILFSFLVILSIRTQSAFSEMKFSTLKPFDPAFNLSNFLIRNYSKNTTRICYDAYTYVPPQFKLSKHFFSVKKSRILKYNCNMVIISKSMTGRWVWKKDGTSFKEKKLIQNKKIKKDYVSVGNAKDSYELFHFLLKENSFWKLHYEDNNYVLFYKRKLTSR